MYLTGRKTEKGRTGSDLLIFLSLFFFHFQEKHCIVGQVLEGMDPGTGLRRIL